MNRLNGCAGMLQAADCAEGQKKVDWEGRDGQEMEQKTAEAVGWKEAGRGRGLGEADSSVWVRRHRFDRNRSSFHSHFHSIAWFLAFCFSVNSFPVFLQRSRDIRKKRKALSRNSHRCAQIATQDKRKTLRKITQNWNGQQSSISLLLKSSCSLILIWAWVI